MARSLYEEEFLIQQPELNPDEPDIIGYSDNSETKEELRATLHEHGITVFTHPNVIDLGSGRGSVPKLLAELKWIQNRILCVDWFAPRNPLVKLAHWLFFDVDQLIKILSENLVPEELEEDEGGFDMLITAQTNWSETELLVLASFFLLKNAEVPDLEDELMKVIKTKNFTIIVRR